MKKIIARIILYGLLLVIVGLCCWRIIIQPCIEFYHKHGIAGVGIWLLVLLILGLAIYGLIKIAEWAANNA